MYIYVYIYIYMYIYMYIYINVYTCIYICKLLITYKSYSKWKAHRNPHRPIDGPWNLC